jgi:hypothetical protein
MGKSVAPALVGARFSPLKPQRLLALLLVVFGHAVLIYLIASQSHALRPETVDEFTSVPIYLTPTVQPEREAPRKADVADQLRRKTLLRKESTAIALPVPESIPIADAALPDWSHEAEEAARRMANPVVQRRGFGKPPEDDVVADKPPVGVFERGPSRRMGDIEMIGPGIERRWYSANCFQEFGHLPDLFPAPGLRVNPVRCLVGPRDADGTLFEHLKPEYLKQQR